MPSSLAWTTRSVYPWIWVLSPISLNLLHQEWYRTSRRCPVPNKQQLICTSCIRSIIFYCCRISNVRASLHSMQASKMLSRYPPYPQSKDGMLEWQFERSLTSSLVFTTCSRQPQWSWMTLRSAACIWLPTPQKSFFVGSRIVPRSLFSGAIHTLISNSSTMQSASS